MTTPARAGTCTGTFRDQHGAPSPRTSTRRPRAAAAGDWKDAAAGAARVQAGALHLHHSVVRDALAGGLDWWGIGEVLAMHPQAAFEEYANLADGDRTPARQRPAVAVTCTAGLASLHDLEPWHGIDIDDLDSGHSLSADPTVARLREAAKTARPGHLDRREAARRV